MSNVIITRNSKRLTKKATGLLVTPYYYDNNDNKYYLGPDTYDLFAIVGDTIAINQDDGDVSTLENEFTPIPVIENRTLGVWKFTADCVDMQNSVLRTMFGAKTSSQGAAAMPSDYRTLYCLIQITFLDENTPTLVLPKVLLSSGMNVASLKSDLARNALRGTPMLTNVCVLESSTHAMQFSDGDETTYTPRTPLLFLPKNHDFGVLHHKDVQNANITYFSTYSGDNIVSVSAEDGTIEVQNT